MRLNRRSQLGILLTLYLVRSGRTTVASAAEGLGVSSASLQQVAYRLAKSNVIKAFTGPNGGVELVGEPTVQDVLKALTHTKLLTSDEARVSAFGCSEKRALLEFTYCLTEAWRPMLSRKVKSVMADLSTSDMRRFHQGPQRAQ